MAKKITWFAKFEIPPGVIGFTSFVVCRARIHDPENLLGDEHPFIHSGQSVDAESKNPVATKLSVDIHPSPEGAVLYSREVHISYFPRDTRTTENRWLMIQEGAKCYTVPHLSLPSRRSVPGEYKHTVLTLVTRYLWDTREKERAFREGLR